MQIVWFAEIKWDYLRTRKQQIIRQKPDDIEILYLEPYVRGRENRFDVRSVDGIHVVTVPFMKIIPGGMVRTLTNQSWVRRLIDTMVLRQARRHLRTVGFSQPGAIISNVYAAHIARRFNPLWLAYDCNDAHFAFPGMPAWTEHYFSDLCRRADLVIASAAALRNDVVARRGKDDVVMVGNGVDTSLFRGASQQPSPSHDPPCIGYLGAVAPWFEFDTIATVARAHPEWRIRIVGPIANGVEREVAALSEYDNIEFSGAVSHDEVPAVMRGFTVGLIPFRYNELTRGVNPNKMYEYLAAGVPVVATAFSDEVKAYPDVVAAVEPNDDFTAACERAVAMRQSAELFAEFSRRASVVAAEHDWSIYAKVFWGEIRTLASAPPR